MRYTSCSLTLWALWRFPLYSIYSPDNVWPSFCHLVASLHAQSEKSDAFLSVDQLRRYLFTTNCDILPYNTFMTIPLGEN